MWNAVNNNIYMYMPRLTQLLIAAAITMAMTMTGCKGGAEKPDPAQNALDSAKSLVDSGKYAEAIEALDAIDSLYPQSVAIRREATNMRPQVIEKYCMLQLAQADSALAVAEAHKEQLLADMRQSQVKGFADGYWTSRSGHNPRLYDGNGVEARVTTTGDFYMVSSLNPTTLRHHSFSISSPTESVTSPMVSYDGELNMRVNGGEVVSYFGPGIDSVGEMASRYAADGAPALKVTFHGQRGDKTITLTHAQVKGIAQAYDYATTFDQLRNLSLEVDRLNQQLLIARRQQAPK